MVEVRHSFRAGAGHGRRHLSSHLRTVRYTFFGMGTHLSRSRPIVSHIGRLYRFCVKTMAVVCDHTLLCARHVDHRCPSSSAVKMHCGVKQFEAVMNTASGNEETHCYSCNPSQKHNNAILVLRTTEKSLMATRFTHAILAAHT